MGVSYKDAGVDIEKANTLVERIKPLVKSTARTGANTDLGGFGGLFDMAACGYRDPVLVSATDGVGTKLSIVHDAGLHSTIGIDLVAMCVNDLIVQGAAPLFFLDYFATGILDNSVAVEVVEGIAQGCRQAGAALIGGETAEMPGMYQAGHYDLAGFAVGAVERDQILPKNTIAEGDAVIGIASSGLHSNGYSLVRKLVADANLAYTDAAPFPSEKQTLGEALLTPTYIYVKPLLSLFENAPVKALAHITGGGFTENIPRVLPKNMAVELDCSAWQPQAVFQWLANQGNITADEMLRTFNCGIGMVLIVAQEALETTLAHLAEHAQVASHIGHVVPYQEDHVRYINREKLYDGIN